ncbi:uncharacterized protein [Euphorbia lathyris]|uniref:uncharacterized protein n=1 Tax=Euphorbia lathyris TaxID=212925 RepID=UPI003313340A
MSASSSTVNTDYSHLIEPSSYLGQRLCLKKASYFGMRPVALSGEPTADVISGDEPFLLDSSLFPLGSKKSTYHVFPRDTVEWKKLVDRFRPSYTNKWKEWGIYNFIDLSCHEFRLSHNVITGALNFWSTRYNSLMLPLGLMSMTLRDVMAITGLPMGEVEIPGQIHTELFPELQPLSVQSTGKYCTMMR